MKRTTLWKALFGRRTPADGSTGTSAVTALIEEARAHARAGRLQEASGLYWKLKSKQQTPESLVEHAELLLELGDFFSAASKAADALELSPGNARALAVQREVVRREDAERPRRK